MKPAASVPASHIAVVFDTAAFQAGGGAPVSVTLRPRPGTYGLTVETSAPLRSAELTFKYAVHFRDYRDVANSMLIASTSDRWDGRDANGRIVNGGIYVFSVEWGLVRGEHSGRDTAGVAVVR